MLAGQSIYKYSGLCAWITMFLFWKKQCNYWGWDDVSYELWYLNFYYY